MRDLGFSYRKLEESGVMLPVLDFHIKYLKPALYDDLLTVVTTIKELPSAKITFEFEMFNENGDNINFGTVVLVFVDAKTMRPIKCPIELSKAIENRL